MRKAMESELADATRMKRGVLGPDVASDSQRKVLIAAAVDATWSAEELALLEKTLRLFVTPMTISRTEVDDALRELGAPLVTHPLSSRSVIPGIDLLDDTRVEQARRVIAAPAFQIVSPPAETSPQVSAATHDEHWLFARKSTVRFSEQIEDLERKLFEDNGGRQTTVKLERRLRRSRGSSATKRCLTINRKTLETLVGILPGSRQTFNGASCTKAALWRSPSIQKISPRL